MSSRLPIIRLRNRPEPTLPPPAVANSNSGGVNNKRTTFEDPTLPAAVRVHWSRFKKRLGNGSNPSESLLEVTDQGSESVRHKRGPHSDGQGQPTEDEKEDEDEEVDEVVVDNAFLMIGPAKSVTSAPSEHGASPEKGSQSATYATHMTDAESYPDHDSSASAIMSFLTALRYRVWSIVQTFFFTSFYDPVAEAQYKKETYFQMKGLALAGTLFLIINWVSSASYACAPSHNIGTEFFHQVLVCIVIQKNTMIFGDKMFYWVVRIVYMSCWGLPLTPLMSGVSDPLRATPVHDHLRLAQTLSHPLSAVHELHCLVLESILYVPRRGRIFSIKLIRAMSILSAALLLIQFCGYYKPSNAIVNCHGKEFTSIF